MRARDEILAQMKVNIDKIEKINDEYVRIIKRTDRLIKALSQTDDLSRPEARAY